MFLFNWSLLQVAISRFFPFMYHLSKSIIKKLCTIAAFLVKVLSFVNYVLGVLNKTRVTANFVFLSKTKISDMTKKLLWVTKEVVTADKRWVYGYNIESKDLTIARMEEHWNPLMRKAMYYHEHYRYKMKRPSLVLLLEDTRGTYRKQRNRTNAGENQDPRGICKRKG